MEIDSIRKYNSNIYTKNQNRKLQYNPKNGVGHDNIYFKGGFSGVRNVSADIEIFVLQLKSFTSTIVQYFGIHPEPKK